MSNVIPLKTRKAKKSANSRPTPRSAKTVAQKPAAKGRTASVKGKKPVTRAVQLEALLRRPKGATAAEVATAMGIQEHTARALISVERRKQGWEVTLEERRYRISS